MTLQETYPTSQECHSERDCIGDEMAKAYPDAHDFEIACRVNSGSNHKVQRLELDGLIRMTGYRDMRT